MYHHSQVIFFGWHLLHLTIPLCKMYDTVERRVGQLVLKTAQASIESESNGNSHLKGLEIGAEMEHPCDRERDGRSLRWPNPTRSLFRPSEPYQS